MNDIQPLKNSSIPMEEFSLSEFMLPEPTFRGKYNNQIRVFYITDIHLIHHFDPSLQNAFFEHLKLTDFEVYKAKAEIRTIVKKLFNKDFTQALLDYDTKRSVPFCEAQEGDNIVVLFGGDISFCTEITEFFYHEFITRWDFVLYERWKEKALAEHTYINLPATYKNECLQRDMQNENAVIKRAEELKRRKHCSFRVPEGYQRPERYPIYTVIGNHELIDFPTVQEAVDHYKNFFQSCKIHFLHNEHCIGYRFNIIGGIGFAKYNQRYNALTLQTTTPPMSREDESYETDKFVEAYQNALIECQSNYRPLIVLSHYPINDWLANSSTNSICIYFNGHNHTNKSATGNIYADNQIGYKRKKIAFKSCSLGIIYNPFCDYTNGCYEITPIQYAAFLRYKGEPIAGTSVIDKQLSKIGTKFYMIKESGFYGFFIINLNTGAKICTGGAIRNISYKTDINYFHHWFIEIVSAYAKAMAPYRKVQEQISDELKTLGFEGTIHGCIIDLNFFNHIMIDPISGKLTFYYSPVMGTMQTYPTFDALVTSISQQLDYDILHYVEGERATSKAELLHQQKLLSNAYRRLVANNSFITQENLTTIKQERGKVVKIDIKNSTYTLSRYINQLQRIFTTNILRVWDDSLIEKIEKKKSKKVRSKAEKIQLVCENSVTKTDK